MVLGGALDVNAADKAARFVWLCDAFNIPLVFLHDVPGFIVGSAVEKQGIIRHGAKMLFAVSEATVPKISVILRKSYGAGYFVMNGLAYEADYIVAWPTAEIAVMGPDGAVNIIHRKTLEAIEDDDERTAKRLELAEEIRANIDPVHRGRPRAARRRDRPGRHARRDRPRPADHRRQAGRPAVAQARRAPGLTSIGSRFMAEIRAEITANVWQVVVEEGQMVAEGDEICILESMKMEIPVITEMPGVVRELHVAPEQTVQEGDLIALIDETRRIHDDPVRAVRRRSALATHRPARAPQRAERRAVRRSCAGTSKRTRRCAPSSSPARARRSARAPTS